MQKHITIVLTMDYTLLLPIVLWRTIEEASLNKYCDKKGSCALNLRIPGETGRGQCVLRKVQEDLTSPKSIKIVVNKSRNSKMEERSKITSCSVNDYLDVVPTRMDLLKLKLI